MNITNANLIYIYISLVDNGHSDANITNDVFEHRISVFLFFVILSVYALLFIHQKAYLSKFFYVCDSTKKDYLANNRSCICKNSMFDQIQIKTLMFQLVKTYDIILKVKEEN